MDVEALGDLPNVLLLVDLDRLTLVIVVNLHAEEVGGLAEVGNLVALSHETAIVVESLVGAHAYAVVDEAGGHCDNVLTLSVKLDVRA